MEPIFKIDLKETLNSSSKVVLELGSGRKKKPGRILIDIIDMPHIDIIADLEQGLSFLPDNCIDEIHSKSLLEHIDHFDLLMKEIWRVLKPSGKKYLYVPHFSNPYYFSDYTHRRFFGLYSFEYFSGQQRRFKRKVPSFYNNCEFITEDISLVFRSPWKTRKLFKQLIQKIINLHPWIMEFYEENLCYIVPCSALKATLKPIKANKPTPSQISNDSSFEGKQP
ncbi:class I SAM-dependent methyltransferase [Desulfobacula phenolica]|uniref:Methyltransferase domain-containing protein n=1 Tax=Desulfobacula phenolica TaxID=90732 RepID=A0A1H2DMT6_9BACT|nr:methyltransferase domain-containing protein [Desulfobacula phenolica]SDT84233.1 Methyltransferase domain-containing protein [Desulfobacula phenolica]